MKKFFKLLVTSSHAEPKLWVNGQEITSQERRKQGSKEYTIDRPAEVLRAGRNVLAVQAEYKPDHDLPAKLPPDLIFDLHLDEVHIHPGAPGMLKEYVDKSVYERAVVCDLCSGQPGKVPACVNACPHDAAMRIDARSDFPRD